MTVNRIKSAKWLLVLLAAAVSTTPAFALDRASRASKHRGFVDGSAFAALASDDETLIQVSIQGPLLKMATAAIGSENEELAGVLNDIVSITAVIVGVEDDDDRAQAVIAETVEALTDDGWQVIARIREDGNRVLVLALTSDGGEALDGLTVVVSESGDDNLIFANIAGRIDLARIGEIGAKLGVPGLSELTGGAFAGNVKKHKSRSKRKE